MNLDDLKGKKTGNIYEFERCIFINEKMTKQELSVLLADTLAYYVANPKGKRCEGKNGCMYSGISAGKKTKGCFIGSLMKPKDRKFIDDKYPHGQSVYGIFCKDSEKHMLPTFITQDNLKMFEVFQGLHDGGYNWAEKGLSKKGKKRLEAILKDHKKHINRTPFQKFLR